MVHLISRLMLFCVLSACANVQIGGGEGKTHHYFGFVSVQVPEVERAVEAYKVTSYGLAIEDGLMIGARDTEMVLVPLKVNPAGRQPHEATCAMVIIVRSNAEAQHARQTLKDIKGDDICLATF